MSLKIGMAYDLRKEYMAEGYSEDDVAEFDSEETVAELEQAIASLGHRVERIGSARTLCSRLVKGDRWDLVFNIAEGMGGRCRESQVPCLLDLYGIAYTFSDGLVCAATLDKGVAKRLVRESGLETPKFHVINILDDVEDVDMEYPFFVKPLAEGTGKGINGRSRITSPRELSEACRLLLDQYRQPVLVEEYLPGREFTVGILGTGDKASVLGTMEVEILPEAGTDIYSFEVKEECERLVRYSRLEEGPQKQQIEDLARKTYIALQCRDAGRVDIRLDHGGRPSFMEINPLPGLHPNHSDLPMIATREGMAYPDLIGSIIRSAMERVECDRGA